MNPWIQILLTFATSLLASGITLLGVRLNIRGTDRATKQRDIASIRETDQRELAARRDHWWNHFTWTVDLTFAESAMKRKLGLELLKKLSETELAGRDEALLLKGTIEKLSDLGQPEAAAEISTRIETIHHRIARGSAPPSPTRQTHTLFIVADAAGFSRMPWGAQIEITDWLLQAIDKAAESSGLARKHSESTSTGDGKILAVPNFRSNQIRIVDKYIQDLEEVLADRNKMLPPARAMKLRLAMHCGIAVPSSNGYGGEASVEAARLVDSGPLRDAASKAPHANFVAIFSEALFSAATDQQPLNALNPNRAQRVRIDTSTHTSSAWIYVPDETPPSG